jgi:hypothetical protein
MTMKTHIGSGHPLRKLFSVALAFGAKYAPEGDSGILHYIEDQILCEFIHVSNLYRIRDTFGSSLFDVAEILIEGSVPREVSGYPWEFQVHRHIGDYTLFMLGMFPEALKRRKGKEFIMGSLVLPGGNLSDYYLLQGKKSYQIASEISQKELFSGLSKDFPHYMNILHFTRMYLDSVKNEDFEKARKIIS